MAGEDWYTGKSAPRVLGWEFGRTAREMNVLLEQHGYLDGFPGATWNDETAVALRAGMEAGDDRPRVPPLSTSPDTTNESTLDPGTPLVV